jgi:hypothetical protein
LRPAAASRTAIRRIASGGGIPYRNPLDCVGRRYPVPQSAGLRPTAASRTAIRWIASDGGIPYRNPPDCVGTIRRIVLL